MTNPYISHGDCLIKYLSDEDLLEELAHWKWEIENATHWGAAVAVASEFKRECEREIALRKKE